MIIYWAMLAWTIACGLIFIKRKKFIYHDEQLEVRSTLFQAILTFSFITFFIGLRSGVADTPAYILVFKSIPQSLNSITLNSISKDKGFYLLQVIFKQVISSDYHVWLFFVALISCIGVMIPLYKHSPMFGLSAFIFIASSEFTWLLNGMRQFIVASILFACVDLMLKNKTWKFIVIVLLLSTVHGTAIIMIPIYFIVKFKPWSKKVLITAFIISLLGVLFERFSSVFSFFLEGTQYDGYIQNVMSGNGSSIFRLFIAMVPCVLAFLNRKKIRKNNVPIIDISINMSLINVCLMFISTLTSGLLMGRLSVYFDLYNLILLPWVLLKTFKIKEQPLIIYLCVICYTMYFYYQMVITWHLPYISDVLSLYIFN